jgi:hypothetical protein
VPLDFIDQLSQGQQRCVGERRQRNIDPAAERFEGFIAGGGRKAGKTTLAAALGERLPNARVIKVGHHAARAERPSGYFLIGTPMSEILDSVGDPSFLIIESGALLDDPELSADLVVFLPSPAGEDKPGSERRRARADLIRGEEQDEAAVRRLAERLGLDSRSMAALVRLVDEPTPANR